MNKDQPLPWEKLTDIDIPIETARHIEALWAEVMSSKEELSILKKKVHDLEKLNIVPAQTRQSKNWCC